MSTIRPLATIAILAVVGVFLAQKINQNPAGEGGALSEWGEPTAEAAPPNAGVVTGVPPIGAEGFSSAAAENTLPAPVAGGGVAPGLAEVPPLPPTAVGAAPAVGAAAAASDPSVDLPLPSNIPTADYSSPGATAGLPGVAPPTAPSTAPPVAPFASADSAPFVPVPTPGIASPDSTPPIAAPVGVGPTAALPPAPPEAPALASAAPALPSPTRGFPSTSPGGGYAAAKPAIDAALTRNELSRALLMLSGWRGDPTLSLAEKQEIDALLGQLAGSVIYSNQHLLEGPYTVRPGDTLQTIAQQHAVPWELLGKINGVVNPLAVTPGQTIKVVRGPFRATVDLSENELFLTLDGRYAGRFPVTLDGAAASEGSWRIEQKGPAAGKQMVLSGSAGASFGQRIIIGATAQPTLPTQGRIAVADRDLGDLFDILSVGSEVTVRR